MKKLLLGAMALMLVVGSKMVAIDPETLGIHDSIAVTTEDNKIVLLPSAFIKESTLLRNLVDTMKNKNELQNSKKHKLQIPYHALLTIKNLFVKHELSEKDDYNNYTNSEIETALKHMGIGKLAHIVEALNYLGFDPISKEAINILHEKTSEMKFNFKKKFGHERIPYQDQWHTINNSNNSNNYYRSDYDDYYN